MSGTKQKIFVIVVLVLVILFGVGQFFAGAGLNTASQQAASGQSGGAQGGPTGSNTNPLPTEVIDYVPDPTTLATSTPIEQGSCFASSIAAPYRTDAWRCTVGDAISDPCFEMANPDPNATSSSPYLLCGANPAGTNTSSTFVLQLTKALPTSTENMATASGTVPTNWAWLVQLNDGTICSPFTGTRPFDASGDVAIYSCNGGATNESMIFGDLNNASATWTAEVGSLSTATSTFPPVLVASATVPVFAVWQ
jgi:hypothetical protein